MDQTNSDSSGDTVVYSASLPKGLTLNPGTGCFSGTLLLGTTDRARDAAPDGHEPSDDEPRPDLFIDPPPPPDSGGR